MRTKPRNSGQHDGKRHLPRFATVGLLLVGLTIPVSQTDAAAAADPTPVLASGDPSVSGPAAIEALGDQLDEVAAAHDVTATELTDELLSDDTLQVDPGDRLLYVEDAVVGPPFDAPTADPTGYWGTSTTAGMTEAQAFNLSSRPASTKTIYLDFNGHVTAGTAWNSSYGATITTPAFSADADAATFSQDDLNRIAVAWASVAETYAAFDVNVTTKDPGVEALRRTTVSDVDYGIRVVIGPNTWYGNAGGVAYLGSFSWNSDTPAFVFSTGVSNVGKWMGDAASHEAGHSFGLKHDGANAAPSGTPAATGYYYGQGAWAPVMGVGYNKTTTQWSKGEYLYANNNEDDVAIIATNAPSVTDSEGSPASPVALGALPTSTGGVIATRTDVDSFSIATGGSFTATVTNRAPNPTLDASITIRNAGGTVVASADPAGVATASVTYNGAAGSYTISIDGVGSLDPSTTGYSDYASIGGYSLSVTGTNPAVVVPHAPTATLTPSTTTALNPATIGLTVTASDADGDALTYSWDFGDGTTSGGFVTTTQFDHVYATVGSYTAAVTVKDPGGLSTVASTTITVEAPPDPAAPVAVAGASTALAVAPAAIVFSGADSADPQARPLTYDWDFGDGTASTEQSPAKVFTAAGAYTVRLTVANDLGLSDAATLSVQVNPNLSPRIVAAVSTATGFAPTTVKFSSAGTYDPEAGALTYLWRFGDGRSSTLANPSYTYKVAGRYTASLTVTDPLGQPTVKSFIISVKAPVRLTATVTITKVSGTMAGRVTVTVKDALGRVVRNAKVTGRWSGVVTGTTIIAATNSYGKVGFTSKVATRHGTLAFTVTKVTPPIGWVWDGVIRARSLPL